jgi:hypothetical protein
MEGEDKTQNAAAGTGITAGNATRINIPINSSKLTVTELAPLAIGLNGKPARKVTFTCELPEAIAEQIRPGMTWDGQEWQTADGEPVELRELSTA